MSETNTAIAASAPIETANAEVPQTSEDVTINQQGVALEQAKVEAEVKKAVDSKKKYSLKVNGKQRDVELDLSDDNEIQKQLQKAYAADEKFQEAALTRKQMEYLVEQLRTNPLSVLQHESLGINVKELAQKVMEQELEDLSKSPEQKRIDELEKKLKEKEDREKTLEDEKRQNELARMQSEASQALDDQITEAISKSSLPKSPYTVKRLADAMIEAVNMGYTDVTPDQIMPFVEQQLTEEIQRLFEASPDEVMEKLVSKKRLDGYRKARVSKAKAPPAELLKQAIKDTGSKPDKKKELPPFSVKDLLKF